MRGAHATHNADIGRPSAQMFVCSNMQNGAIRDGEMDRTAYHQVACFHRLTHQLLPLPVNNFLQHVCPENNLGANSLGSWRPGDREVWREGRLQTRSEIRDMGLVAKLDRCRPTFGRFWAKLGRFGQILAKSGPLFV